MSPLVREARTGTTRVAARMARAVASRAVVAGALFVLAAACGSREAPPQASQASHAAAAEPPVVVFFGDSITRGLGLPADSAYPALIQKKLDAAGIPARCVNEGVSGDTTESALARIDDVVRLRPSVVVVELGANDVARGMNRLRTQTNLHRIVETLRDAGARVIVARTRFPHMQHPAYMLSLERAVEDVAEKNGAAFIPDLMAGVAGVPELNLKDGIHPNVAGQERLAENAWPTVREVIAALH